MANFEEVTKKATDKPIDQHIEDLQSAVSILAAEGYVVTKSFLTEWFSEVLKQQISCQQSRRLYFKAKIYLKRKTHDDSNNYSNIETWLKKQNPTEEKRMSQYMNEAFQRND